MRSDYYVRCIYSIALHTSFIMEANNANPDQTATMGSSLTCMHCLKFWLQSTSDWADDKHYGFCSEYQKYVSLFEQLSYIPYPATFLS